MLLSLQLRPETKQVCSPEDDLQNRVNFDFVKNNIIATSPNRPAYSGKAVRHWGQGVTPMSIYISYWTNLTLSVPDPRI